MVAMPYMWMFGVGAININHSFSLPHYIMIAYHNMDICINIVMVTNLQFRKKEDANFN